MSATPSTPVVAEPLAAADADAAPTRRRPGPLEGVLGLVVGGLLGMAGAAVYGRAIGKRNRRFDAGEGVMRLDRAVISVGNLSVGGTGKTPMVARLAAALREAGRRPCIAMRGYARGKTSGGESDEAAEYARVAPGVPVVAQADRIAGLRALFASEAGRSVDCVVLDDGFQHRQLARDVDIVLIDASAGTLSDRLVPWGWLREPVESLARAQAVVVTHSEQASEGEIERILQGVRRIRPGIVAGVCGHAWSVLLSNRDSAARPVEWLRGHRVVAVCAIGNPGAFLAELDAMGALVVESIVRRDHDPYARRTVERIVAAAQRTQADAIFTTDKDWSKLRHAKVEWGRPVLRPRLELVFERGWEELWGLVAGAAGLGRPTLSGVQVPTGAGVTEPARGR